MFKLILKDKHFCSLQKINHSLSCSWYSSVQQAPIKQSTENETGKKASVKNGDKRKTKTTGLTLFVKDSLKIAKKLKTTKTRPSALSTIDLFNKDTELLMKSISHPYKTIPKGKSIIGKTNHILNNVTTHKKGVKISQFPESRLGVDTKKVVEHIVNKRPPKPQKNVINNKTHSQIKVVHVGNMISDKDLDKKNELNNNHEFNKQRLNDFAKMNNIEIKKKDEINVTNDTLNKNNQTKNDEEKYWYERLKEEDAKYVENILKNSSKIFKSHQIDRKFLVDLIHYPLCTKETIEKDKDFYDKLEIDLINGSLFKMNDRSENYTDYSRLGLPSVTRIIDATRDEKAYKNLLKWKVETISKLGYEGFLEKQKQDKQLGLDIHKFIEGKLLKQEDVAYPSSIEKEKFRLLEEIFQTDISDVLLIEKPVIHSNLFYKGIVDCVAYYKGKLCLIDWKSSEKSKSDIRDFYEYPVQVAAYIGAFLNDTQINSQSESMKIKENFKSGVLVNFNKLNGCVNVHEMNYQLTEYYWYKWMYCVRKFWSMVLNYEKKYSV